MDIDFVGNLPDSTDKESDDAEPGGNPQVLFQPESVLIPLPSNLGRDRQEITLREGQANDMLHAIRVHLADKAMLFRTTVRLARSWVTTTRAWSQVHSVEHIINLNSTIYKKCRAQLSKLRAEHLLEKYRELQNSDLKATLAVADPNSRGDSVSNDWMNEFYRVHWLRTKALWDRWAEEMLLVGHVMRWTIDFLAHKAQT
ncbi:hypothetical protein P692DRAFT_201800227 [Suillus brevipes Sb2]|nr:hypothetical protein P692DRAFT_201800227 [Suillus brevipes Sb2]